MAEGERILQCVSTRRTVSVALSDRELDVSAKAAFKAAHL